MITIFKYPFILSHVQVIKIPADAEILSIQMQNERFYIWVKLDTEKPKFERNILVFGTGAEMQNDNLKYISSIQDGAFVWHFFEVLKND